MKFLGNSAAVESEIGRLLRTCTRLRWAVAWASYEFPLFRLLQEHRKKIEQLTVGIHFYQTHPEFIASFSKDDAVKFVMNPDGVFHPKVYFFEYGDGRWECIVGSPNFTRGAFTSNTEVAVLFSSNDSGASNAYDEIICGLDKFHSDGEVLTDQQLAAYRAVWEKQQSRLGPLSGKYSPPDGDSKPQRSPLSSWLFMANWTEYFESVKLDSNHPTEQRLAVLDEARKLFHVHPHFLDMSPQDRAGIAGIRTSETLAWRIFGNMTPSRPFTTIIGANNPTISHALDEIPISGEVRREDFDRYCRLFTDAIGQSGVATATRLLAMKRPDYFVCLNDKNNRKLREEFEIPKKIDLERYWSEVVERLTDTPWWNSPEPEVEFEKRIWRCRAAFLDVRFYNRD